MTLAVTLTIEELDALVRRAVREEVARSVRIPEEPPEILTRQQASELLGVNPHQIPKLIAKGLPGYRFGVKGKQWRFRRSELLRWVAERKGT